MRVYNSLRGIVVKPETYEELARKILASAPRAGATRVISVDGPSGSGKTTFAERLSAALECPVIHMDDIFPGWDGLAEAVPLLAEWILEPLSKGLPARYRRFDWHAMEYAEWNEAPVAEALVVEGVGSGARPTYLSYLVWVEAPKDLRMRRGVERDGEAFRPHWERWARQEEAMFEAERTKERADLFVDGSPETPHDPEREFVGGFALWEKMEEW